MESGFNPIITVDGVISVLNEARNIIPETENAEILEIRVGLRPYSLDGKPLIGPVKDKKGVWIVTGHGPLGLTAGPYTGKLVAESIINNKLNEFLNNFALR